MAGKVYDVFTDLDPQALTAASMAIYQKWIAFSLGFTDINGHTVMNPTGTMAASVRMVKRSSNWISIIADAPEAEILESGHGRVDLKLALEGGRSYPMHRGTAIDAPMLPAIMGGKVKSVAAAARGAGFNGYARVPSHITAANANSWIIPAMAAWSPAAHLADMLRDGDIP